MTNVPDGVYVDDAENDPYLPYPGDGENDAGEVLEGGTPRNRGYLTPPPPAPSFSSGEDMMKVEGDGEMGEEETEPPNVRP